MRVTSDGGYDSNNMFVAIKCSLYRVGSKIGVLVYVSTDIWRFVYIEDDLTDNDKQRTVNKDR